MWFALCLFLAYLVFVEVCDYIVADRVNGIKKKTSIEINQRCDEIDSKTESIAWEILNGMQNVANLPENKRAYFIDKYGELLFEVDKTKSETSRLRSEFSR